MPSISTYRGRFAPSPTGPLHFGSLAAAVGSYLDAKHHHGIWLVRMEDLDTPRCVPGAADNILRTLETFGLHWDEEVISQSLHTAAYEEALHELKASGAAYPCCCTRREIADSSLHGIDGQIYPGNCRSGLPAGREGRAWRIRTDLFPSPPEEEENREMGIIEFNDILQGRIAQHIENEIGDFVVKRADGLFAYQLAVVVDDAFQHITHVVRGADLLHSTPRQIYLQRLLRLTTPAYMHLPIAVNTQGMKLSKQTLAPAIKTDDVIISLIDVLKFLHQEPPTELRQGSSEEILKWSVAHWRPQRLKGSLQLPEK